MRPAQVLEGIEIRIPNFLGTSTTQIQIAEWIKNPGEEVWACWPLVTIVTTEVSLDLDAPADGKLLTVLKRAGETVQLAEVIAIYQPCAVAPPPPPPDMLDFWGGA
jgi:pyruvate/2-oxoglutarate dehydrogenase complex dihydrolipoamide acyltransferase (E2) component